jgi:hypothetical protein
MTKSEHHCTQTADGLATWIERRTHTPAELRQILRLALKDAEARGEQRAPLAACPGCAATATASYCLFCRREFLASERPPADPTPEPVVAVEMSIIDRPKTAREVVHNIAARRAMVTKRNEVSND